MIYKIAFSMIKGMNPTLAGKFMEVLCDEKEFFSIPEKSLQAKLHTSGAPFNDSARAGLLRAAEAEMHFISDNAITPLYYTDPRYPQRLLECEDAPLMLYMRGMADLNAAHVVSIVGTRNCTQYGVDFINRCVSDLHASLDNLLVVSGLAVGCDITAQRRAVQLGVPTAGVVAHGLDTFYPAENRSFASRMVENATGAILSDYPHGTQPHRSNFLARNRIVAGMADCVVVAESAAARGGALHTARLAQLYNRDVFALPGRTCDLYSGGCNMLIREGVAQLVESAADIIEAMRWTPKPSEGTQQQMFIQLSPVQQQILDCLRRSGDMQINSLAMTLDIPVGQLMAIMVEMEFNGHVVSLPGARYRPA